MLSTVTGRISAVAAALACLAPVTPHSGAVNAQTTTQTTQSQSQSQPQAQQPEAGVEDDPTRAVFFSVREEYRNLRNGAWNNRFILRKDVVVLKGRPVIKRGFLLRADLPITTTHLGSETRTGLGDLYGQALYIPYLKPTFAFVAGTGVFFPTATAKTLGTGKWQIAPLAGPVWYLWRRKGFVFVKIQDFISIAGVGDRPDIHALSINPILIFSPNRRWWVPADLESRTNWKNRNKTDFRVGLGLGRVIGRKYGLEARVEVPFGGTRSGDWTVKVSGIQYR
jgi:hypothetical protein